MAVGSGADPSRSGTDEPHTAVFSENERHAEPGVFRTKLASDATEGPSRWCDEVVFLPVSVTTLHDNPTIVMSWPTEQVSDSAISCGGLVWLSHTAHRSASGA